MNNWKYKHYISQLERTTRKVHENFVVSSLMHDERLLDLLPLTQHYLRRDEDKYALIDLYYPQLNLAIEIDEEHHKNNHKDDLRRQKDVEERNGCQFWRVDVEGNVLEQVENLKQHLIKRRLEESTSGQFNSWQQPKSATFEDLQFELQKTLFVKIRGKVSENELLRRQTGTWSMNSRKQAKVTQVVVVHDRIVSRVFRELKWDRDPSRGNKWAFTGKEVEDLEIVGSLLLGWNYQSTRVYSNDIEGRTSR